MDENNNGFTGNPRENADHSFDGSIGNSAQPGTVHVPSAYQAAYGNGGGAAQTQAFQAQAPEPQQQSQMHSAPAVQAQPAPSASHVQNPGSVQGGVTAQHSQATVNAHIENAQAVPAGASAVTVPAQKAQKGGSALKTFLIALLGAAVGFLLFLLVSFVAGIGVFGNSNTTVGSSSNNVDAPIEIANEESTLAEAVASKCLPSVGSVMVYSTQQTSSGSILDYLYGYGMDPNSQGSGNLVQSGMGSAVMLTDDGYLITNYHVVEGGSKYEVTIEGDTHEAQLVGTDPSSDVAVLKIDGSGFTPIAIGDSDNITIGEWVMSIGSPFGLEQSVATGIVSAVSRSQIMDSSNSTSSNVVIYPNMIQTDAAINPGNSGGALVDAQGQLIGINTLITSYSGNYSGVGFAIPVNYAVNIADAIIDGRQPTHAQLGVSLTTINASIAERYGFAVDEGAYVSAVSAGSGAEAAGIEVGDIITSFDGKAVTSASDLMLDVRSKNPGDVVELTINRDGSEQNVEVTLGSSENSAQAPQEAQPETQGNPEIGVPDIFNR